MYTLALFEFYLLGTDDIDPAEDGVRMNVVQALGFVQSALQTYLMQLGAQHPSTRHVQAMTQVMQSIGGGRESVGGDDSLAHTEEHSDGEGHD